MPLTIDQRLQWMSRLGGLAFAVLAMGLLYLLGLSHRIPLLGRISSWALRAQGESGPSLRSIYAYGAGYVLVGIG